MLQATYFALSNPSSSNPGAVHGVVYQGHCAFIIQSQCEVKTGEFWDQRCVSHVSSIQNQVGLQTTSSHLKPEKVKQVYFINSNKTKMEPQPTLQKVCLRGRGGSEATEGTSHPQMESAGAEVVCAKLGEATGDNGWVVASPRSDIFQPLQSVFGKLCWAFPPDD